ncbi:T9SS type A sorting domain-containing protein [uncultured Polaribacter sp.]|uniref:T9SS type A sorting domain-containing protein n=1 Tax=uncultured Polaribacter sp. TaxID=174711 RepID=UPI002633E7B1|nr:T9SS type A sorting domain-containing protein [uncultured Polaribacter sp.]
MKTNFTISIKKIKNLKTNPFWQNFENFFTILILFISSINLVAQDEATYYTQFDWVDTETLNVTNKLDNTGYINGDDSSKLQALIDAGTNLTNGVKKGRRIQITAGNYYFKNIKLRSNIHLRINPGAKIFIANPVDSIRLNLFLLGQDNFADGRIRNVSITSTSATSRYAIDFRPNNVNEATAFKIGNIENFKISGINIRDKRTKYQAIGLAPALGITSNNNERPIKGLIKDIKHFDADYGFGLVQIHSGKNIFFKNLESIGGTTLRVETDYRDGVNEAQNVIVEDIVGRNITCERGNSAVTLSPHERNNGKVDIRNITAKNCGWAVRIENSFEEIPGVKERGEFGPGTIIKNVNVTYGWGAVVKKSHLSKFTCTQSGPNQFTGYTIEDQPLFDIVISGSTRYKGQSIAGALYDADYDDNVNFTPSTDITVVPNGFTKPNVITEPVNCSSKTLTSKAINNDRSQFTVYPNPAEREINLTTDGKIKNIQIFDLSGRQIISHQPSIDNEASIDVSQMKKGMYVIQTVLESGKKITSKFVKK